ncbi:MAG: HEAT repeat domain-containing protein [Candidatus Eisenbacteria bacterium]
MKFVDHLIADHRAQKLRAARSLPQEELVRLQDELVRMGAPAIDAVVACLGHGEARGPAMEILHRMLAEDTLGAFLLRLASPNPAVVSAIGRVLASSGNYDARRLLALLAEPVPPKSVLEPILLARADEALAAAMITLLPGLPRESQSIGIRILEQLDECGLGASLVPLLADGDPWLRAQVARALVRHPDPQAVPSLIALLGDEHKGVRLVAVETLRELRAAEAVPDLIAALRDPDLKVQSAVIDTLSDLADVRAVPRLLDVLTDDSEQARRGAVEVLNEVATAEAVQDLVRALRDADWWVRVRAADALGSLGGDNVVPAVIGLMNDPDEAIRRHAVEILNAVPHRAAVPALVAALADPDWWVRERAIEALARTGDERALAPLLALLDAEPGVAGLCVRALAAIGHPRALRPLVALADSPLAELRSDVLAALGSFPQASLDAEERSLLREVQSRSRAGAAPGAAGARTLERAAEPAGAFASGPARGGGSLTPGHGSGTLPSSSSAPRPVNYSDLPADHVLLHRYRVLRKVGRGGFGTVYLVEDSSIQEEIILKILNPQLSLDETAARRFVQELKLTRRISHRNVIRIHDFLELDGVHAVSMEYFPGGDLGRLLVEGQRMDPLRGLRIASQVCAGLAAAHERGVVHRDIKPANILVGEGDDVRVVDFGLASAELAVGSRLTQSGLLIGSPEYMAPEQISGAEADHRADLYALGIVMYEMFSGYRPYTAETPVKILFQHLEGGAIPLAERAPGIPPAVADLVERAMARDAENRPRSALELRDLIERIVGTLAVAP